MRKVILQEFVSLDGLAAGTNNSVDFIPASTQGDSAFGEEQLMKLASANRLDRGAVSMIYRPSKVAV